MLMLMLTQHFLLCCFTLKALMDAFNVEKKVMVKNNYLMIKNINLLIQNLNLAT